MKKLAVFALFLLVLGCATGPKIDQLHALKAGMTRAEVMEALGKPSGISLVEEWYILTYNVFVDSVNFDRYEFYFNGQDLLWRWNTANLPVMRSTGTAVIVPTRF